jgi:ADP-heptose:LPS heptosyltransferase
MDSAGGHLASMYKIPCMLFYGTNESKYFYPKGNEKLVLLETEKILSCRPCSGANCTNEIYQNCLHTITKKQIEEGIEKLISYG